MPTYYFSLRDRETLRDAEGIDLAGPEAARSHALTVARELTFKSEGLMQERWSDWTMHVHDERGAELFAFRLTDLGNNNYDENNNDKNDNDNSKR